MSKRPTRLAGFAAGIVGTVFLALMVSVLAGGGGLSDVNQADSTPVYPNF